MNHKKTISEVLANAYHFIKTHEWECEADKKEYEDTVDKLAEMIEK
jgi:hypothetical protein